MTTTSPTPVAVILVPRRSDGGHRDALWRFCREWWERDYPEWPIFVGDDEDRSRPFCRAGAVNEAARLATAAVPGWEVAHVIDADVLADPVAVRSAVELAHLSERLVVAHDRRMMLTEDASRRIMDGYRGPWDAKGMVRKTWPDSVSCSVAVPRSLWDKLDGMDERFVGWGFEDTAFTIAAEAISGRPLVRVNADVWHLWHPANPDAKRSSPTYQANEALVGRYRAAVRDEAGIRALLDERDAERRPLLALALADPPTSDSLRRASLLHLLGETERFETTIPRILHRTVPAETSEESEAWWGDFARLHPEWQRETWREPLDPADFPLTSALWDRCQNGAQKAGLVRLELLVTYGGVYVDSDVEPRKPLDSLLGVEAFAAWEDETTVPDAVLGSRPHHPAFEAMLDNALQRVREGQDAWKSGPGVTTFHLPGRGDVLLLPPGAFYPYHYLEKHRAAEVPDPWAFAVHHWRHSWGTPEQRASIERRQRRNRGRGNVDPMERIGG